MRQKSPGSLRPFGLTLVLLSGLAASTHGASHPTISATSTFQRQVDTPSPGPSGTLFLQEKRSDQIFSVTINNLSGVSSGSSGSGGSSASDASFAIYISVANDTNIPVFFVAPLNLRGTNDTWNLKYEGVGAAPAQLGVADLQDLSGLYLIIGNPGPTNIVGGVTNIVGCTTNVVGGATNVVGCVTNIVGGVTNFFVNTVLFTQIPALTTKAQTPRFNRKTRLTVPSVTPPNPHEKGYVRTIYTGSQGRSVFDLTAKNLSGGQSYSIFIEFHIPSPSSTIMSNIGPLVISTNNLHIGTFTRDTRKGETLPFQVTTVRDLSGRAIQIQDSFHEIHLQGTIP